MEILAEIGHALWIAFAMFWEFLWPLILGFGLSGVVQAVVSKGEMSKLLPDDSPKTLAIATGLGAASSSCSYAAVALARSIFRRGANFTAAMAFELASTNLVAELSIILIVLMGWQYGWKATAFVVVIFYFAMAAAALIIESVFRILGLIPQERKAHVVEASISFNYTTVLNVIFLLVAGFLVIRFLKTGGPKMLAHMD
jgi:uncharacterized membrane protein YraQ (UPF0718 family)